MPSINELRQLGYLITENSVLSLNKVGAEKLIQEIKHPFRENDQLILRKEYPDLCLMATGGKMFPVDKDKPFFNIPNGKERR